MVRNYQRTSKKTNESYLVDKKREQAKLRMRRYRARKKAASQGDGKAKVSTADLPCTSKSLPAYVDCECGTNDECESVHPGVSEHSFWLHDDREVQDMFADGEDAGRLAYSSDPLMSDVSVPPTPSQARDELFGSCGGSSDPVLSDVSVPPTASQAQDELYGSNRSYSDPLNTDLSSNGQPVSVQDLMQEDDLDPLLDEGMDGDDGWQGSGGGERRDGANNLQGPLGPPTVEWLAGEMGNIRLSSYVSDMAIEKLYKFFVNNVHDIMYLKDNGIVTDSYLGSIKPRGITNLPTVLCSLKLRKFSVDEREETRMTPIVQPQECVLNERNLLTIPLKYLRPCREEPFVIVNQEAKVRLADLKAHFEHTHKHLSSDQIKTLFRHADFSIDGVKESSKSSRKLIIATLRFGQCILPYKVLNPLKGDKDSPRTAEEQIR